ncbi:MAG: hypothetical protein OXN85_14720 [Gemmatimonadetes bacterium]|nr:hypothetical protein [Candidatus Palauibacter australiensis]
MKRSTRGSCATKVALPMLLGLLWQLLEASIDPLAALQQAQFDEGFPLRVEEISIVGLEHELGIVADAALGPDGSVHVADMGNAEVVAFDHTGDLAWRSGGSGDGPGEFRALYRLTVAADGTVYVYDPSANAISRLSSAGSFIDRQQLAFGFAKMDDLVVDGDGRLAIVGIAPRGPSPDSAIHVFDSELLYVSSFAPAPVAANPMSLAYSGAGTIALTPDGRALFVRRLPYEIHDYSLTGRRFTVIEAPFSYDLTPDDAISITEQSDRIEFGRPTSEVPVFHAAISLTDSTFVVGRREGTSRYWDLFTRDGRHIASTSVPNDWGVMVGYDLGRRVLWVLGEHRFEPVLRRLRLDPKGL